MGPTRDYDIVAAMRRGESASFEQFVERFHRILLDYARRAGVPPTERDELVGELLDDVAIQLMTRSAPLPQNPRMYLLSALRHRLLNRKRGRERRTASCRRRRARRSAMHVRRRRIGRGLLGGSPARELWPRMGEHSAAARDRAIVRATQRSAASRRAPAPGRRGGEHPAARDRRVARHLVHAGAQTARAPARAPHRGRDALRELAGARRRARAAALLSPLPRAIAQSSTSPYEETRGSMRHPRPHQTTAGVTARVE